MSRWITPPRKKVIARRLAIRHADHALVPLSSGEFAVIDLDMADWIEQFSWSAARGERSRRPMTTWCGATRKHRYQVSMARMVLCVPLRTPGWEVDHINGNTLDNRRCNLRLITKSQNQMNRPGHNKPKLSSYIGLRKSGGKWFGQVQHEGRTHCTGPYLSEIEAARARDGLARQLKGAFARLNFPEEAACLVL